MEDFISRIVQAIREMEVKNLPVTFLENGFEMRNRIVMRYAKYATFRPLCPTMVLYHRYYYSVKL